MGKIKLTTVSNLVIEKPLITAFKAGISIYAILDNEANGSMGLPIILVSKLENNKLVKVESQDEWQQTKEYLKNIIAGNRVEYVNIPAELIADDIYYTQLTLPVSSFDALKNNYSVSDASAGVSMAPSTPVETVIPATPTIEPTAPIAPIMDAPTSAPEVAPVIPEISIATPIIEPVPTVPSIEIPQIEMPVIEPTSANAEVITPPIVEAPVVPTPEMSPVTNTVDFSEDKAAFLKACENMFDALVVKFKNDNK